MNILERLSNGNFIERLAYTLLTTPDEDIYIDMKLLNSDDQMTAPTIHGNAEFFCSIFSAVTEIDHIKTDATYAKAGCKTVVFVIKVYLLDGAILDILMFTNNYNPQKYHIPTDYPFIISLNLKDFSIHKTVTLDEIYCKTLTTFQPLGRIDSVCSGLYIANSTWMAKTLEAYGTPDYSYDFMDGKTGEVILHRDRQGIVTKAEEWCWLTD